MPPPMMAMRGARGIRVSSRQLRRLYVQSTKMHSAAVAQSLCEYGIHRDGSLLVLALVFTNDG
jgi:hypothetical protein